MNIACRRNNAATFATRLAQGLLAPALLVVFSTAGPARADEQSIEIKLGDYRFSPSEVQLLAGQPAVLKLINTDGMTPHNFTLQSAGTTDDINVDVAAGDAVEVRLDPLPPGNYTFFCDKKLPFMKSHRARGMEGRLVVTEE